MESAPPNHHHDHGPQRQRREPPEEVTVRRDTLIRLSEALEEIISRLTNQVYWLKQSTEMRSMHWRCLGCGKVVSRTMPAPLRHVIPCEGCKGEKLEPVR